MSGPNPRAAAVAALVRQEQDGFSNLILDAELRRQKLEGRDKAFASAIFYTVLEHQGTLDYLLSQFLPKGLAKLDPQVREILRAALAQARYMQVPASAAVNEAVKLTRTFRKASASGLVNAVLRRAIGYDLGSAVFADEVERLMVLGSAGRDVAAFLHEHYPDEALDILTHTADGGLTSLRANPLKGTPEALCEKLLTSGAKTAVPGLVPGSVLARFEGSPAESGLFRDGYFHVGGAGQPACRPLRGGKARRYRPRPLRRPRRQEPAPHRGDAGRRAAGELRRQREPRPADPQGRGADGVCPRGAPRLRRHQTGCRPAHGGRYFGRRPCSGLGILAKKPDIRYKTLEKARHDELLATQSAILDTAAAHLKEGGRLVYSTCTIDPAENEEQVRAFVGRHPEFRVVTPDVRFPAGMTVGDWGALSVPTRTGMDGFFLCTMQKRDS